jgi:hypothetical protein
LKRKLQYVLRYGIVQFTGNARTFPLLRHYGFLRESKAVLFFDFRFFKFCVLYYYYKNNGYNKQGKKQEKEKRVPLAGIGQVIVNAL